MKFYWKILSASSLWYCINFALVFMATVEEYPTEYEDAIL